MLRIMLVDDEPFFIRHMRETIESLGRPYEVVGEAYDAGEAMSKMGAARPDLAFIDVRMPGVSGLDLVRSVRSSYPEVIPVILSGYQDFDLVREAFRAEAEDYLLKPIDEDVLGPLLDAKSRKVDAVRNRLRHAHVSALARGESAPDPSAGVLFDYERYAALLIPAAVRTGEADALDSSLATALAADDRFWPIEHSSERYAILIGFGKRSVPFGEFIDRLKAGLASRSFRHSVVASDEFHRFKDAGDVYIRLRASKDFVLTLGGPTVRASRDPRNRLGVEAYKAIEAGYGPRIEAALMARNWEAFSASLEDSLAQCEADGVPKALVKRFLARVVACAERLYPRDRPADLEDPQAIADALVDSAFGYGDLRDGFISYLCGAYPVRDLCSSVGDGCLMGMIDRYLSDNIARRISVGTACAALSVSPPRLNRLIRKYRGLSFVEYFSSMKIEKAKAMLDENGDMSIGELADRLGFSDNLYFSKVFRRIASIPPSEYRSRARMV